MAPSVEQQLKQFFPDLPSGPLDEFRKRSSFDWRKMKLAYDTISMIKLKHDIWTFMENHPAFHHPEKTPSLEESKRITAKRMSAFNEQHFVTTQKLASDPGLLAAETEALFSYDGSLGIKRSLAWRVFSNTITAAGGPQHEKILQGIVDGTFVGCFALTEVAHGSNVRGIRTTASYCPGRRSFVLHSDDFEAAKCWAGALGKSATHAIVFAKLITKGEDHGLHMFVVPIRDPKTLKLYPGVIVGDLGDKIGLHGVDNGFLMFNHYYIPKELALDRLGGVDDDGVYMSPFSDSRKRFGATLGSLSGPRIMITGMTTSYLQNVVVIAVRYSAVRRQFGSELAEGEIKVLEYQQQQIRVLPYLAAAFAMRIFSNWFIATFKSYTMGEESLAGNAGKELHALSSATKAVCTWAARDGIQNCREACGGFGYLKAAAIGVIRDNHDAMVTFEGENNVLVQQASNWLLSVWSRRQKLTQEDAPYGSLKFLVKVDCLLRETCCFTTMDDMMNPLNIIHMYNWLTAFTLRTTFDKLTKLRLEGKDPLEAKNEAQTFYAVNLAVVYGENVILNSFYERAIQFEDPACKAVLLKLVSLYGAFTLEKHMAMLYIGNYFTKSHGMLLRETILTLCAQLVPEAVALADSLAPPDFCLNSVLGCADGEIYKRIQDSIMTYPGAMTRPSWWKEIVHWETNRPSKL